MNNFELHEKRIPPPVFLPIHYTRNVPKDKDEENRIVDLILYKNHFSFLRNLHRYVGPPQPDKVCTGCLSTFLNEDELWNRQKHKLKHEPCITKISKETTFRVNKLFIK